MSLKVSVCGGGARKETQDSGARCVSSYEGTGSGQIARGMSLVAEGGEAIGAKGST